MSDLSKINEKKHPGRAVGFRPISGFILPERILQYSFIKQIINMPASSVSWNSHSFLVY